MTPLSDAELAEIADRCEAATGADKTLNRAIALLVGWHRYTPSELSRSNPGWIAPEDWIGEYEGKGGRRTPKLNSLHGTDIWREPRDFTGSLDAAMTLVPEGMEWEVGYPGHARAIVRTDPVKSHWARNCATPALALCAAALRARAIQAKDTSDDYPRARTR